MYNTRSHAVQSTVLFKAGAQLEVILALAWKLHLYEVRKLFAC
jgi:hypothetical protein